MKRIFLFIVVILQISGSCLATSQPSLDDLIQAEKRYSLTKQKNLNDIITQAQSGDKKAQQTLGLVYREGFTGVINREKSFYWFNLAAIQEDPISEFYVGLLYHEGDKNTPPDYSNALKWYEKAANHGNTQAQVNCANIYQFGPTAFKDINKAKYWLLKAAETGDPIAHANLGLLAAEEKKYDEAASYLKYAAEKGQRIAQYNYATLFLNGTGVAKNIGQAKYWYEKAAAQDLPDAQIYLGRIYASGADVKGVDKEKALYWLNMAKEKGAISEEQINAILSQKND